jgi:hypothetical protein
MQTARANRYYSVTTAPMAVQADGQSFLCHPAEGDGIGIAGSVESHPAKLGTKFPRIQVTGQLSNLSPTLGRAPMRRAGLEDVMLTLVGAAARLVFAAFAIAAFSSTAEAALSITYVASNGNDANPCTVVTAPCETLTRAVSVTPTNGTVRVLTALQGNVVITKSITISGDGAPVVGTITISGASTIATLRGLELNGVGIIANGIRIDSAAAIHIENCTVERYAGDGIKLVATTATELFVSDTVVRDNGGSGLFVNDASARATVEDSRFENNAIYGLNVLAANVNVTRSAASGNAYGIGLVAVRANLLETTASTNTNYGIYVGDGDATLTSSAVNSNGNVGLYVGSGAAAVIIGCVFMLNVNVDIQNSGTLYTRENNTLAGQGASGTPPIPLPEPLF